MPQNTNVDPLEKLHDIIAPSAASWWPLPLIVWLILLAVLLVGGISVYLFKRYQQQRKAQQQYLTELATLENKGCDLITLNKLLKVVSLSYFPRTMVASLHGGSWFDFLVTHSCFDEKTLFKGRKQFLTTLYDQSCRKCDNSDFKQAQKWITQLPSFIKTNKKHQALATKRRLKNV